MANKSMYSDIANKATTKRLKNTLVLTQLASGAEVTKGCEAQLLLASELDKTGSVEANTLARRYNSLTMNPVRAQTIAGNAVNTKAFNFPTRISENENIGVNLSGAKSVTAGKATGFFANALSINLVFKHQLTSVTTARVIVNQLLGSSLAIIKPIFSLTRHTLTIKSFATVGDADITTGVTLVTRTLEVDKIYSYQLIFGGLQGASVGSVLLYENGTLIYANKAITFDTEYIASLTAGMAIQCALEETWLSSGCFNFTFEPQDVLFYGNYYKNLVRERDKWGSNVNIIPTLDFSLWADINISSKTAKTFTTSGSGGVYFNPLLSPTKQYRIKIRVKNSAILKISDSYAQPWSYFIPISAEYVNYEITYNLLSKGLTASFYLQLTSAGTCDIETLEIYQTGALTFYGSKGINIPDSLQTTAQNTMTAGQPYEVSTTGDIADWAVYGAPDGLIGTRFVAKASATTANMGTSRVKLIAVDSRHATADYGWYDESTSALHATVAGNPIVELMQLDSSQIEGSINFVETITTTVQTLANPTLIIPPNYILEHLTVKNTNSAQTITAFKVGSSAGASDIIANDVVALAVGASRVYTPLFPMSAFSEIANTTLNITMTGHTTASYETTMLLRRVK